ncbi:hypothetical protein FXE93_05165 [Vibrio cholerae]|nr:hypothetical protein [Vibrio cholerae]EGR3852952.1 hypothetical protein [Vibrio cholerae]EGR4211303.1 hypothetical protein [Vibrio cholerae]EGR4480998.1 hypothetical protein [Vibrio cholerae]MBG8950146.1 hypothetical protein [Vibrio cholerae]
MVSVSLSHFKYPLYWRFDLIVRARRLECGVYEALTKLADYWVPKVRIAPLILSSDLTLDPGRRHMRCTCGGAGDRYSYSAQNTWEP